MSEHGGVVRGLRDALARWPFVLRWTVAVAVSMIIGAGLEYSFASGQLERRALEISAVDYTADLATLGAALAADLPDDARREAVQAALLGVKLTHGTEFVGLFDARGRVVGQVVGGEPEPLDPAEVREVLSSGRPSVERETDVGEAGEQDRYEFLLPLESPDARYVVEIDQREDVIAESLADLRLRQALGVLLSVLIAVPLSYVLGGRALNQQRRRAERTADTDALTGLSARRPFRPLLQAALADPAGTGVVLAIVDIDDFKQVNDRLGHSYGDRVLCALADSFGVLRASDTAFRLGGDEFAVVLTGVTEAQGAEALERVRHALAERAPGIGFSCGVASALPEDPMSLQELWERADAALYDAKAKGRRRTVRFTSMTDGLTVSTEKLDAVGALLSDRCPLTVAFQPIWDFGTARILGHEALLRLPADAPIDGPQEAFELAHRLGICADLDARARRTILAEVRRRDWEGLLFLNIHPDALPTLDVDGLLAEVRVAGLQASDVILEVTEHAGLDMPESIRVLKLAHARGFRLALDDMGRSNAGLRALTHVRFDVVKLDRDVVTRLGSDPSSDATIAAATTFVQQTGGWVVAEGIEDLQTLGAVLDLPQRPTASARIAGQGYLLGRPGPAPVAIETRLEVLPEPALAPEGPLAAQVG